MRGKAFTKAQILAILAEGEAGANAAYLARRHGVSKTTYFRWKAKDGGTARSEVQRVRKLEEENRRLKRLVADLALDNAMLKDVVGRKW